MVLPHFEKPRLVRVIQLRAQEQVVRKTASVRGSVLSGVATLLQLLFDDLASAGECRANFKSRNLQYAL